MNIPKYDWQDVFDKYVDLLSNPPAKDSFIRDASELPYPRDVIRAVLLAHIKTEQDLGYLEHLKVAYLTLANFLVLTEEEREAVQVMSNLGSPSMSTQDLKALADKISAAAPINDVLMARYQADAAQFQADLAKQRPK